MNPIRVVAVAIIIVSSRLYATDEVSPAPPPVQHFVTVEENVKLEVIDWGGSGRPLVLLAGLGDKASVFDTFARKLTSRYRVYGITRRGFGASSVPVSGYSGDRLGEDVVTVLDALKIERPILIGHSIAGSELSYVATVHPEKIAALVYLDSAYAYAFYDEGTAQGFNLLIDAAELRKMLAQLPCEDIRKVKQVDQDLLARVQVFEKDLRDHQEVLKYMPEPPKDAADSSQNAAPSPALQIMRELRKYRKIPVPILAIYAFPKSTKEQGSLPSEAIALMEARDAAQIDAFQKGNPSAHVVRIPNASHYIFKSNEAEVLHEIEDFINKRPSS